MKSIRTATHLKGKIVLIRAALNVPVEQGKVTGSFRLQKALKTILFLQKKGAKVVLLGHIGDKGDETLRPVFDVLTKAIPHLSFSNVTIGPEVRTTIHSMNNGDVLMLENVRRMKGEKENDHHLAEEHMMNLVSRVREKHIRALRARVELEIRQADAAKDAPRLQALVAQFQEYTTQLNQLQSIQLSKASS
jgi:3-phosphoglycerate kinase